jgi:hypothetical protein
MNRAFCLCLALFVSPLKSKSRLEAENTALRHQAVSMEQTIIERRRCANRARYPLTETDMKMLSVILLIGGAALLTATPVSLHWSQNNVAFSLDSADARIGRPRTALSVAGVQGRAYRRAYRGAAYGGVAGYGAGSYYSGYGSPAYSYGSGYAPYYGSGYGYGSYYGGYGYPGFSTTTLYDRVPSFRLPGWRY